MFKNKSSSGYQKIELISVGNVVDLEILMAANSKRVKTEFIGYLEGQYIILNYPNQKLLGKAAEHVKEGASVIVRAVADHSDGQIIAFKTDVKAVAYTPTKLIFLYPPQQVQSQSLRHHIRIPTLIPATLATDSTNLDGVIKDISHTGLLFSVLGSKVDLPKLNGQSCHVVIADKKKQETRLQGEICSTTYQDDALLLGIKLIADEGKVEALMQQCLIDLSALHDK